MLPKNKHLLTKIQQISTPHKFSNFTSIQSVNVFKALSLNKSCCYEYILKLTVTFFIFYTIFWNRYSSFKPVFKSNQKVSNHVRYGFRKLRTHTLHCWNLLSDHLIILSDHSRLSQKISFFNGKNQVFLQTLKKSLNKIKWSLNDYQDEKVWILSFQNLGRTSPELS